VPLYWACFKISTRPYKKTVDRWLWPDLFQGQRTSVSRAKGAITKYKQALGDPVV